MRNIKKHQGKLEILKRLPSSVNGNPRYLLSIGGYTCKTAVDSSHGYCVTNYDGKEVNATIGTHYGSPTLDTIWSI
jgi:hypothetical protein